MLVVVQGFGCLEYHVKNSRQHQRKARASDEKRGYDADLRGPGALIHQRAPFAARKGDDEYCKYG